MQIPQILFHHLCYALSQDQILLKDLTFSIGPKKVGLVGRNGVGKSTLLKLIVGMIAPSSGNIQVNGSIAYCPQEPLFAKHQTIAELFGVAQKWRALKRIQEGSIEEQDFTDLNEDWNFASSINQSLAEFGLNNLSLDEPLLKLSGGERTRIFLAKCFNSQADFIILDEPTNNLDASCRQYLYHIIRNWKKGLIVVSHDRALLNEIDEILELTSLGLNHFGGNYDFYHEQKALMQAANQRELLDAKKSLAKTKDSIQQSHEKSEQKKSYGRKLFLSGKVDRLTANSHKGRSEKTQARNATLKENRLKITHEELQTAKSKIEISELIHLNLPKTEVPNGKIILNMEQIDFYYPNQTPLIKDFNFSIQGPERIAICGNNGSGKTTLVKLIMDELQPTKGMIERGTQYISYLDQNVMALNQEMSILDNFLKLNPEATETNARLYLAQFLFKNIAAHKIVCCLSGGEKLRALLACVLMAQNPPQLLILDEPTNHLDLISISAIESALKNYRGALLVISHDAIFLGQLGITRMIQAPFR